MSMDRYEHMIYMERPKSQNHPPMPMADRAVQFAPFAALTGFSEKIRDTQERHEAQVLESEKGRDIDLL
ncbi:MAG: hypothetical protein MJZ50_10215 [Treponema sp.]|nr:hypothetical protein [Treponema sp.]